MTATTTREQQPVANILQCACGNIHLVYKSKYRSRTGKANFEVGITSKQGYEEQKGCFDYTTVWGEISIFATRHLFRTHSRRVANIFRSGEIIEYQLNKDKTILDETEEKDREFWAARGNRPIVSLY